MRLHEAVVEEVFSPGLVPFGSPDDGGAWGFQAVCLETGIACDAWGFCEAEQGTGTEGDAIERALEYLSDQRLHLGSSPHFCPARHVLPRFATPPTKET